MKSSIPAWILAVIIGIISFMQYRTIDQLRLNKSAYEQLFHQFSIELDDKSQERAELLQRIQILEEELLLATSLIIVKPAIVVEANDFETDRGKQEAQDRTSELYATESKLEKRMREWPAEREALIIRQKEDFRIKVMDEYGTFLDSINMNEPDKQNILAQIIDNNDLYHIEFQKYMKGRAGEIQVDELILSIGKHLPSAIMEHNLTEKQYSQYLSFSLNKYPAIVESLNETKEKMARIVERYNPQ